MQILHPLNRLYSAICLYDVRVDLTLSDIGKYFLKIVEDLTSMAQRPPDWMSTASWPKVKPYGRMIKKLPDILRTEASIGVGFQCDPTKKFDCDYLTLEFDFKKTDFEGCPTWIIKGDADLLPLGSERSLGLAKGACTFFQPVYGFGFQKTLAWGPSFAAHGMLTQEDRTQREKDIIVGWGAATERGFHRIGYLRDIYPLNFLNETHLRREIQGVSMRTYIQKSKQNGSLSVISPDVTLWNVEEEHIPRLIDEFGKARIIFDYKEMVEKPQLARVIPRTDTEQLAFERDSMVSAFLLAGYSEKEARAIAMQEFPEVEQPPE